MQECCPLLLLQPLLFLLPLASPLPGADNIHRKERLALFNKKSINVFAIG